jgi:hypothetical protein
MYHRVEPPLNTHYFKVEGLTVSWTDYVCSYEISSAVVSLTIMFPKQ